MKFTMAALCERGLVVIQHTIAQFQRGKWQRYGDPQEDTLLTGRSSYLDENADFLDVCMTMDPNFKIPKEDWLPLSVRGMVWQRVGDGVLAKLSVDNRPGRDGKSDYQIDLPRV
jgi:hypothetical protein